MPSYDFKQLSPHDFEELSRNLIQARDGIQLESFKNGRDHGIDFRHAHCGANVIVQCKHYAGTGVEGLLRELKKEAVKAQELKPSRYILVTSVGLAPQNKSDIQALSGNLIVTPSDVIGPDDLNNLLEQHESIHTQHYKLWLGSTAVLNQVLHNASITQSEFDAERVHQDICRYVSSEAYPRAVSMLIEGHVAIISGAPGVGKTTLARMLLYDFLEKGYEAVSILTDFQTGRERYQPGKKQIFYFDDFIGATFLGERASTFTRNEDRVILDFIEMVRASKTARLVMTTREHILQQAIAASEKLRQSRLVDNKCVLEIRDYSRRQRAEILYNHIHFSDLPEKYRHELLSGRFYHRIVDHEKFNPRLIDWLSNFRRVKDVPVEQYRKFVEDLLDDPAEIWLHAYQAQISDAGRSILLALYTHGGQCGPDILEGAFWPLHGLRASRYGFKSDPSDWRRGLQELNGSFIRPGKEIEVIDPSVLDMLNGIVRDDPRNTLDMLEAANRFEQARRIWQVANLPNNQPIIKLMSSERGRVVDAFTRVWSAPYGQAEERGFLYFDDKREQRLALLLEVAEQFQATALVDLISSGLYAAQKDWESEHFDISDGIALADRVGSSAFVFGGYAADRRMSILEALAEEAATGCSSNELRELLDAIPETDVTPEISTNLEAAASYYRKHYFSQELHELRAEHEFEALTNDLISIAERLSINLEGPIHSVDEAKAEFDEHQSRYEDQQYEEWKDRRYDIREADRELDDLFGSLRGPL